MLAQPRQQQRRILSCGDREMQLRWQMVEQKADGLVSHFAATIPVVQGFRKIENIPA